jgi:hypothetical protein
MPCAQPAAARTVDEAMPVDNLSKHVAHLLLTVPGLDDPPSSDAIELFNRFLAEARTCRGPNSLVHEIPELGLDARREDLFLWVRQLSVAVER